MIEIIDQMHNYLTLLNINLLQSYFSIDIKYYILKIANKNSYLYSQIGEKLNGTIQSFPITCYNSNNLFNKTYLNVINLKQMKINLCNKTYSTVDDYFNPYYIYFHNTIQKLQNKCNQNSLYKVYFDQKILMITTNISSNIVFNLNSNNVNYNSHLILLRT